MAWRSSLLSRLARSSSRPWAPSNSLGAGEDEGSETLRTTLAAATWPDGRPIYTLPVALSIMVFFALCAQCLSTLVVIKKETGSYGWSLFSFGYMTALAYLGALATYQVGHGLGLLKWTGKRQWPSPLPRSPERTCCGVWRGLFSKTNPTATNLCRSGIRTTSCGNLCVNGCVGLPRATQKPLACELIY